MKLIMDKVAWRNVAIMSTLLWIVMFISNNYLGILKDVSGTKMIWYNIFYGVPVLFSIILIIVPTRFMLHAIMYCLLGIANIQGGTATEGVLMYLLGFLFAFKAGVPLRHKGVLAFFVFMPLIALSFQYRFGVIILVRSSLEILFLCAFLALASFLLKDFVHIIAHSDISEIDTEYIDVSCLTRYEQEILRAVSNNIKFSVIGDTYNKSESAIKHDMVAIYRKLGVESKKDILKLITEKKLLFKNML